MIDIIRKQDFLGQFATGDGRRCLIYIESPAATDDYPIAYIPNGGKLVRVVAVTDTGTVDFNIERRAQLTPDVAGTNVWTADKQATASGLNQTSFDSGTITAGQWLTFVASAVASTPTKLWVGIEVSPV